jgi:hypothetical protein
MAASSLSEPNRIAGYDHHPDSATIASFSENPASGQDPNDAFEAVVFVAGKVLAYALDDAFSVTAVGCAPSAVQTSS